MSQTGPTLDGMLELAATLIDRIERGRRVAVVSISRVARSAPRGVGASMAVTDDGEVIGSISGGCVEGDAVVLAHAVLGSGRARTARFGFDDDQAFAAGLACGGVIDVVVYPVGAEALPWLREAAANRAVTVGVDAQGRIVDAASAPDPLRRELDAAAILRENRLAGDTLILSHAPQPRLLVLGAGDHAAALCRVAAAAGFAVTVCDVWELLVTRERFPQAAELVVAPPHEFLASLTPGDVDARTAVCVLTHDTRLDVPALEIALRLPVGFVGAMGARRTVSHRRDLLRERGVTEDELARLHSPLGLDLGGATPEETALSALAEIVATRHGGSGRPLHRTSGPLHDRRDTADEACELPAPAPEAAPAACHQPETRAS